VEHQVLNNSLVLNAFDVVDHMSLDCVLI